MKRQEILDRRLNPHRFEDIDTPDLIKLSTGNNKLMPTDDYAFLIWNIPAIRTCPFATDLCMANCYAMDSETRYGLSCIESRERHFAASLRNDFVPVMIAKIESYMKRVKKYVLFRIHESGDFYSKAYYQKWQAIAKHFANRPITFQAYTKSINYIDHKDAHLHITFSIWDDTDPQAIARAHELGLQTYSAVVADLWDNVNESNRCYCDDCASCRLCYAGSDPVIVKIH